MGRIADAIADTARPVTSPDQRGQVVIVVADATALLGLREFIDATPGLDIAIEAVDGQLGEGNDTNANAQRDLSRREREVMALIAAGLSNRQIADVLVVSQKTVKNHICRIYQCIGVHDRGQAVRRWRESAGN